MLVGAWKNMEDELNRSGIALILTLAQYFKRTNPFKISRVDIDIEQAGLCGRRISYFW